MRLFTEAERRVLEAADRAMEGPGRGAGQRTRMHAERGGLGTLTRQRALELMRDGSSNLDIAEEAGVTPNAVSHWRRRNGFGDARRSA